MGAAERNNSPFAGDEKPQLNLKEIEIAPVGTAITKSDNDTTLDTDAAKPTHNPRFFHRRRNILLISTAVLLLLLTILVPVLKLVYFPRKSAQTLARNAVRYALLRANFPDPCLLSVNGSFYAFATRSRANTTINIQVASATSGSIAAWTLHTGYDALPNLPAWVKQDGDAGVWAPQVMRRESDGVFVMVYSALHAEHTRKHCLGMATSRDVLGPYVPTNESVPLVCHFAAGGIIDPTFLVDPVENRTVLVWKNDGNAVGSGGACGNGKWPNTPTTFEVGGLVEPGLVALEDEQESGVVGNQTALEVVGGNVVQANVVMQNTKEDGPNIESPQVWYQEYPVIGDRSGNGTRAAYHMLYNSGCFADRSYRIEHLVCWLDETVGPRSFRECEWQRLKNSTMNLLLETGTYEQPDGRPAAVLLAPGGPGVTQDGRYMAFHADIVPSWFDKPRSKKLENGQNNTEAQAKEHQKYTRKRALFIAELERDSTADGELGLQGLRIKRLVMPGE